MKRSKEEERIIEHENSLFEAYKNDQSEENKKAIIAYMETQRPPLTVGWVRHLKIGAVIAEWNYSTRGWNVFLREEAI